MIVSQRSPAAVAAAAASASKASSNARDSAAAAPPQQAPRQRLHPDNPFASRAFGSATAASRLSISSNVTPQASANKAQRQPQLIHPPRQERNATPGPSSAAAAAASAAASAAEQAEQAERAKRKAQRKAQRAAHKAHERAAQLQAENKEREEMEAAEAARAKKVKGKKRVRERERDTETGNESSGSSYLRYSEWERDNPQLESSEDDSEDSDDGEEAELKKLFKRWLLYQSDLKRWRRKRRADVAEAHALSQQSDAEDSDAQVADPPPPPRKKRSRRATVTEPESAPRRTSSSASAPRVAPPAPRSQPQSFVDVFYARARQYWGDEEVDLLHEANDATKHIANLRQRRAALHVKFNELSKGNRTETSVHSKAKELEIFPLMRKPKSKPSSDAQAGANAAPQSDNAASGSGIARPLPAPPASLPPRPSRTRMTMPPVVAARNASAPSSRIGQASGRAGSSNSDGRNYNSATADSNRNSHASSSRAANKQPRSYQGSGSNSRSYQAPARNPASQSGFGGSHSGSRSSAWSFH